MVTMRNRLALALVGFAAASLIANAAQQSAAAGYTTAQATAGATAYQANCATCHQPDLRGQGTASPLAGPAFLGAWGNRPASELLSFIQLTMPPGSAGHAERRHLREHRGVHPPAQRRASRQSPLECGDERRGRRRRDACRRGRGRPAGRRAGRRPIPTHKAEAPPRRAAVPLPRDRAAAGRRPRHRESPSPAKSATTCRSPTRCCAIRIPATG